MQGEQADVGTPYSKLTANEHKDPSKRVHGIAAVQHMEYMH